MQVISGHWEPDIRVTSLATFAEGFPVDPGACEQNEAALGALERSSISEELKEQIRTVLETSRPCAVKGAMCCAAPSNFWFHKPMGRPVFAQQGSTSGDLTIWDLVPLARVEHERTCFLSDLLLLIDDAYAATSEPVDPKARRAHGMVSLVLGLGRRSCPSQLGPETRAAEGTAEFPPSCSGSFAAGDARGGQRHCALAAPAEDHVGTLRVLWLGGNKISVAEGSDALAVNDDEKCPVPYRGNPHGRGWRKGHRLEEWRVGMA
eukprot:Skav224031  [mRNA]  locus=scaffold4539:31945:34640:- [translate_table: standard]